MKAAQQDLKKNYINKKKALETFLKTVYPWSNSWKCHFVLTAPKVVSFRRIRGSSAHFTLVVIKYSN